MRGGESLGGSGWEKGQREMVDGEKGADSGERCNYPYSFQLQVLPRGQPGLVSESQIHNPCQSKDDGRLIRRG